MVGGLTEDFLCCPGTIIPFQAPAVIAFDQVLDLTEDHFQENGLGTGPATPDPAESNGKKDDECNEGKHQKRKDQGILCPENCPEKYEFTTGDIHQDKGMPVHPDEGRRYEKQQQDPTGYGPAPVPPAFGLLCVYPFPASLLIEVYGPVPERKFFLIHIFPLGVPWRLRGPIPSC